MRETRQSGSEGGARFNPLSLPLSACRFRRQFASPIAVFPESPDASNRSDFVLRGVCG